MANECRSVCGDTAGGDAGPFGGVLQHLPGALPRQPPAAGVEEDRRGAAAATRQLGPPAHQVGVQRGDRRSADRHQPLLAALAAQQHRPRLGVDVVDVEADGLGDPRAGRVQQLEQRAVAQRQRPVGRAVAAGALQQRQHLVDGQALGQPPARRRRLDRPRDVECGEALGRGEPVQPADRDQRAGRRHRRQRGGSASGSPRRSATRKSLTSDSVTLARSSMPRGARCSE